MSTQNGNGHNGTGPEEIKLTYTVDNMPIPTGVAPQIVAMAKSKAHVVLETTTALIREAPLLDEKGSNVYRITFHDQPPALPPDLMKKITNLADLKKKLGGG